jgi:TPR repeat protein
MLLKLPSKVSEYACLYQSLEMMNQFRQTSRECKRTVDATIKQLYALAKLTKSQHHHQSEKTFEAILRIVNWYSHGDENLNGVGIGVNWTNRKESKAGGVRMRNTVERFFQQVADSEDEEEDYYATQEDGKNSSRNICLFNYAVRYQYTNVEKATKLLERAANLGMLDAYDRLGYIPKENNLKKAIDYWKQGALKGSVKCLVSIMTYITEGAGRGIEPREVREKRESKEVKYAKSVAVEILPIFYRNDSNSVGTPYDWKRLAETHIADVSWKRLTHGNHVLDTSPPFYDPKLFVYVLHQSIDQFDEANSPVQSLNDKRDRMHALTLLGRCYEYGFGTANNDKDFVEANKYYDLAKDSYYGSCVFARLHLFGDMGYEKDVEKAVQIMSTEHVSKHLTYDVNYDLQLAKYLIDGVWKEFDSDMNIDPSKYSHPPDIESAVKILTNSANRSSTSSSVECKKFLYTCPEIIAFTKK